MHSSLREFHFERDPRKGMNKFIEIWMDASIEELQVQWHVEERDFQGGGAGNI